MGKSALETLAAMLLNVEKFAWITSSVVGIGAVLSLRTGIREKKFAYFLKYGITYLCNIRNEAVAEGALRALIAGSSIIKLTSFFFIC